MSDVRAHEAGWAHADGALRGPSWLREPADPNALVPQLWSTHRAQGRRRARASGESPLTDLVAEHGTPAYVLDEADFRARARAFRDAFAAYDVFYAGKAFLCTTVARWVAEEGLQPRRLLRRRADRRRCAPASTRPGSASTATTRPRAELRRAVELGVGRIIVDSFAEIERLGRHRRRDSGRTARVMVRVTAGVEAHTHEYIATAHEDQKFGFSITGGDAFEAVRRVEAAAGPRAARPAHATSAARSSTPPASRSPPAGCWRCTPGSPTSSASTLPEMDLGGGFGIAYTTQDDPSDPAQLATEMTKIVEHECRALGIAEPRLSIEPGRAIVGPAMCTVYEVGTVKQVALDGGARRTYVSVDGGMSDNIRTALYDADYSCTLASRRLRRAAGAGPGRRQALRGRRHRGQGRVPARRRGARATCWPCPGTGAYCRSMASNYNHALRPPVVAVRDGVDARRRPPRD